MEDKIKQRIVELFKPTLEIIERQSNCEHNWPHKEGSAYYRCTKCGYLADDRELDKSRNNNENDETRCYARND